jgi:hypothetical protein
LRRIPDTDRYNTLVPRQLVEDFGSCLLQHTFLQSSTVSGA